MDFEVEFAAFISKPDTLGEPIGVDAAEENIFGYVLLNDWLSRDIQQQEAVPLGPFNAKNFGTTISPWFIQPDDLTPYMTKPMSTVSFLRDADFSSIGLEFSRDPNYTDISGKSPQVAFMTS